jgi:hypothetical protein
MRDDMKHVIIDRPRLGGSGGRSLTPKGGKRRWQRYAEDEYPKSESTARRRLYGYGCKELNEHLAPLRRWLRSNCGRPWNDVYAEICANLRVDNATQAHVRDHAEQYVLKHTQLIDGEVRDSKGEPLTRYGWRLYPFFVHPLDGTLRETPHIGRRRRRQQRQQKEIVQGDDPVRPLWLIKGIWYEVELAPCPPLGFPYGDRRRETTIVVAGRSVYPKSKRQLGKDEIRKRKLWITVVGK